MATLITVTSIFTAVKLIEAALCEQRFYASSHDALDVESTLSFESSSSLIDVHSSASGSAALISSPIDRPDTKKHSGTAIGTKNSLFLNAAAALVATTTTSTTQLINPDEQQQQQQQPLPLFIRKMSVSKASCCSAVVSNRIIETNNSYSRRNGTLSSASKTAYANLSSLYYSSRNSPLLPHGQFVKQMHLERETKRKTELANKLMYFDYNPHKVLKLNKSDCLRKAVILDAAIQTHKSISTSRRSSLSKASDNNLGTDSEDVDECNILMLTYENSRSTKYDRYIKAVKYEYSS